MRNPLPRIKGRLSGNCRRHLTWNSSRSFFSRLTTIIYSRSPPLLITHSVWKVNPFKTSWKNLASNWNNSFCEVLESGQVDLPKHNRCSSMLAFQNEQPAGGMEFDTSTSTAGANLISSLHETFLNLPLPRPQRVFYHSGTCTNLQFVCHHNTKASIPSSKISKT